jgi:hypothetical protein
LFMYQTGTFVFIEEDEEAMDTSGGDGKTESG